MPFSSLLGPNISGHDLHFTTSCDVINHVTIQFIICHFQSVVHWNQQAFNRIQDIRPQNQCKHTHRHMLTVTLYSVPYNILHWTEIIIITRVIPDFGSSSGKSGIWSFFGKPTKSGSGQISSRIWWIPVQLQYVQLIMDKTNAADLLCDVFVQLIMDKTNAADLLCDVFAILVSATQMFITIPQISSKLANRRNKGSTELYCLSIAADLTALLTPLVSSGVLFCDSRTTSTQIRIWHQLKPDLSS